MSATEAFIKIYGGILLVLLAVLISKYRRLP